jgi:adenosylcobyric acid synthase
MAAGALMIQGTGSDVGNSMVSRTRAGLHASRPEEAALQAAEHIERRRGDCGRRRDRARPRAAAARRGSGAQHPHEPAETRSETGAQVVVRGKVIGVAGARAYQAMKPDLLGAVLESFGILADQADLVLVDGTGSASE